jgi:hypothetical protein
MAQDVYVLMMRVGNNKVGKEWRPVAVVSNPDVATQWIEQGGADPEAVDWVPFELDDFKHIGRENMPEFQPRKMKPLEQRAIDTAKRLQETNERLLKIIEEQEKMLKAKGKPKGVQRNQPAVKQPTSALLQKNGTIEEEAPDGSDDDTSGNSEG